MNLLTGSGSNSRPSCLPRGRRPAGPTVTIAPFSTAFSGSCAPGRPGATCPSGTAPGPRCTAASAAGAWPASGTGCSRRSKPRPTPPARWIGPSTSSMAPSSGRTSMRPGQRGGPGDRSARPQPGRVLDQGPSARRGRRQAADPGAHPGPATRSHRLRAVAGARGGAAARPGPAPGAARPRGGRQRVHRPTVSGVLPAAGHSPHDPAPKPGTPSGPVRPGRLPLAQSGGAADQPLQAISQPGDPLRQARRQLPHLVGARRHDLVASAVAFAYRP